ncbi:MAG: transposase [Phycisphaerae bacterium]|nr:transposase [Phycisphaerae bacterium]
MDELILPFQTYAGKVTVEASDDAMTPFGGIVPWAAFVKKTQIFQALAATSPVVRTSNNALSPYDILTSFSLTTLCDGTHFSDVNRLRHDPAIPEILGMKRVVGDDTIRRFFKSINIEDARKWIAESSFAIQYIARAGAVGGYRLMYLEGL